MRGRVFLTVITLTLPLSARAPLLLAQREPSAASTDSATAFLIEELLGLTRAAELITMGIENAIPAQRLSNPEIPGEFWDELAIRARSDASRFVRLLIPIYATHLSRGQLQQLVAFYQSPLGRHFAEVQPLIAMESMAAGRRWGAQLGAEISADLAQRGIRMP